MSKIGVVGAGHLGKFHIECLLRIPEFTVVGFHDADEARSEEIAEKYGLKPFAGYEELLSEVDAISIVTPTSTHYDLACTAIAAGKHLFIEKPLTDHPDTSRDLADRISARGLIGRVGHVERYNPAFVTARKMGLQTPLFIEAHRLSPFNVRGLDVPVVMDLMIHDIDLVLAMVDADVDHIEANGVGVAGSSADICNARITFTNKAVANLTASRISLKQMRKLRLFQRDQYMAIDFLNHEVQVVKLLHEEPTDMLSMQMDLPQGSRWIAAANPDVTRHNAIEEELRDFYKSIHGDKALGVSFTDGAKAVRVAFDIMEQITRYET